MNGRLKNTTLASLGKNNVGEAETSRFDQGSRYVSARK